MLQCLLQYSLPTSLQIQQQLHTLQLQRSPLAQKPSTQKRRPGAAAAAPGWQQQRAAKAAAAVEDGEAEEVLELLSSEDEGSAVRGTS